MTPSDYHQLFNLLRQYQVEKTIPESKLYSLCEQLLDELWPDYYTQNQQQER
jgi:hypothetical protein